MERALFISQIGHLKYFMPEYVRLYFGNEFCQRLIPSVDELDTVIDFAVKHRLKFSFVTPFVTDDGIAILRPILKHLEKRFVDAEIIINDWGVLRMLKREFTYDKLALGRLLTKQKRGPRILMLQDSLPEPAVQHFKESNVDTAEVVEFLISNGITRVELDNLLQGIARERPALKASLYMPFAYVTTSRYCLAAYSEGRETVLRSIPDCNKECRKYTVKLTHKNMPVDLLLKGNTQFFKNDRLPSDVTGLYIDRIVYEPEIPV